MGNKEQLELEDFISERLNLACQPNSVPEELEQRMNDRIKLVAISRKRNRKRVIWLIMAVSLVMTVSSGFIVMKMYELKITSGEMKYKMEMIDQTRNEKKQHNQTDFEKKQEEIEISA